MKSPFSVLVIDDCPRESAGILQVCEVEGSLQCCARVRSTWHACHYLGRARRMNRPMRIPKMILCNFHLWRKCENLFYELIEECQRNAPMMIAVLGRTEFHEAQQAYGLGADFYARWPSSETEARAIRERVIDHWKTNFEPLTKIIKIDFQGSAPTRSVA